MQSTANRMVNRSRSWSSIVISPVSGRHLGNGVSLRGPFPRDGDLSSAHRRIDDLSRLAARAADDDVVITADGVPTSNRSRIEVLQRGGLDEGRGLVVEVDDLLVVESLREVLHLNGTGHDNLLQCWFHLLWRGPQPRS